MPIFQFRNRIVSDLIEVLPGAHGLAANKGNVAGRHIALSGGIGVRQANFFFIVEARRFYRTPR